MRTVGTSLIIAAAAAVVPTIASATSVDFSGAEGAYTAFGLPDGASLGAGGANFYVTDPAIGNSGIDGLSLSSHDPDGINAPNLAPFRIDFASAIGSFSVAFADDCFLDCDTDTGFLQAFDAGNNLIASADFALSAASLTDYGLLSVTGSAISYVLFWSTSDVEDGENSVYWDNIDFGAPEVPLPGTLGLLGVGLAGLGLLKRRTA